MDEIIDFVQVLIDKGYAYEAAGDVYFRVEKAENYARLANKTLSDLEAGASGRVEGEGQLKEHPFDFALWKSAKPGEVSWESPWGQVVQVGISSARLWRQSFWEILLTFMVAVQTWSFLTIPMRSLSLSAKQGKPLPTTGCTMPCSISMMRRCPSP